MVLDIKYHFFQGCKLDCISKKTEKLNIFSLFCIHYHSLTFPNNYIPVGYSGKPLMGTLSAQSRVEFFLLLTVSQHPQETKDWITQPEPNMKHLVTQMGTQWHVLIIFNLQKSIISSHQRFQRENTECNNRTVKLTPSSVPSKFSQWSNWMKAFQFLIYSFLPINRGISLNIFQLGLLQNMCIHAYMYINYAIAAIYTVQRSVCNRVVCRTSYSGYLTPCAPTSFIVFTITATSGSFPCCFG